MREINENGLCQIEDESPLLSEENDTVLGLYNQAMRTANAVAGEYKDFFYVKSADVESLMNIHDIDNYDRPEIMRRIQIIEEISNEQRPNRPKRK